MALKSCYRLSVKDFSNNRCYRQNDLLMHKDIKILQTDVLQGSSKADTRLESIERRMVEASSSVAGQQKNSTAKVMDRIASLEATILERMSSVDLVMRTEWDFSSFRRSSLECITLALLLMKGPLAESGSTLVGGMKKCLIKPSDVNWLRVEFERLLARCHQELAISAWEPSYTVHSRPDLGTNLKPSTSGQITPDLISRGSSRTNNPTQRYGSADFILRQKLRTAAGLLIVEVESWTLLSCQGLISRELIIRVHFVPSVTLCNQSIHLTILRLTGPSNQPQISRQLKSYPVISRDSEAYNLVRIDDVVGLRGLLAAGKLSPSCICSDGNSLLWVSKSIHASFCHLFNIS